MSPILPALAAGLLALPLASSAAEPETAAALFQGHCGYCHLPGGTGALQLGHRLGKEHALLAERTDLSADYVRHVVRSGLNSMPPLSRVEVTDAELDRIAAYLARAGR